MPSWKNTPARPRAELDPGGGFGCSRPIHPAIKDKVYGQEERGKFR